MEYPKPYQLEEVRKKQLTRATELAPKVQARDDSPQAKSHEQLCQRTLDEYFSKFALPLPIWQGNRFVGTHHCPGCNLPINAELSPRLVIDTEDNSRANCGYCGYPYQVKHDPQTEEGEPVFAEPLTYLLPLHPDDLEVHNSDDILTPRYPAD